jgi:hypothetical protein
MFNCRSESDEADEAYKTERALSGETTSPLETKFSEDLQL